MSGLRFLRQVLASGAFTAQLAAAGAARAECGDGVLDDTEQCDGGNTTLGDDCSDDCTMACTEIGPAATEHTCLHGEFGPFVTVTGQAYPGTVLTNVNPVHTYFTVQLPGAPEQNRSAVTYRPSVSGAFGIYLKQNYPLVVRDAEGAAVPLLFEHAVNTCSVPDSLTWVQVLENLDEGQTYTIDIGPLAASSVAFAIEYLPGFTTWLYPDEDADGVGAAVDPIAVTWCAFPDSLSRLGEDCDDQDSTSYPALLTSPAAPETCDGRDNDCDGEADNASSLCAEHADGTLCISNAGDTFCGCSLDSHCGSDEYCAANARCEPNSGTGGTSGTGGGSPLGTGGMAPGATGGSGGAEPEGDTAGAAGSASPSAGSGGTSTGSAGSADAGEPPDATPNASGGVVGAAGSQGTGDGGDGGDPARSTAAGEAGSSAGDSGAAGRAESHGGRGDAEQPENVADDASSNKAGGGCGISPPRKNHASFGGLVLLLGLAGIRRRHTRQQVGGR